MYRLVETRRNIGGLVLSWLSTTVIMAGCTTAGTGQSGGSTAPPTSMPQGTATSSATDRSPTSDGGSADPSGASTSEALDPIEQRVKTAAESVGFLTVERAQDPADDAWIGGNWHGRNLVIHYYPRGRPAIQGTVTGRVKVGALTADALTTEAFGVVIRLRCNGFVLDTASGDGSSPSLSELSSAVSALAPALGCDKPAA